MDRLIATNSVALAQADVAPSTGTPQYATGGNPAAGVPATVFPAYAWNMIQNELMAILTAAGVTPDDAKWDQVVGSLQLLFQGGKASSGADSGAANAYVLALSPAPSALTPGMVVTLQSILHTSTGTATLNVNGTGALPIHKNGAALTGGELILGDDARLQLNKAGTAWNLIFTTTGLFASINGSASQAFKVADAVNANEAVALGQFGNSLIVTQTLPVSADYDTVTAAGMYRDNGGTPANAPPGWISSGQLLVIHGGFDTVTQMYWSFQGEDFWVRSGNPLNSSGSFNAWVNLRDASSLNTGTLDAARLPESYASLNGNSSETFKVADAANANDAVALDQFPSSLGPSGYKKYPDINSPTGYFIEQWGTYNFGGLAANADSPPTTLTFGINFPNAVVYVGVPNPDKRLTAGVQVTTATTSSVQVNFFNNSNGTLNMSGFYLAKGY